ncbi:hypothetical protein [Phycobacter azelaicus]|uniref:hypothetical protein n=1 Tax=Phycobacter azelaicus TaxID=2668075 RepID=UPI00186903ED|nr:hypothetical protein [Phycobacter azelaicus]
MGEDQDQAARGTELLGVLVAYGPKQLLPELTVDQWDHAGAIGFHFTSRGETGIREALTHRLREFAETGKKPGTRSLFGCFYNALAHSKSLKEPGDIVRITREFIWDHLPMAPGEKILGAELHRRRLHTVTSLAKQEQLDTRSLRNLLATARVIAPKAPSHFAFPALAGEEVARRFKKTEKLKDLPDLLNCSRPLAENLVADRWLELIYHDHTDSRGRAHKTVLSEDVQRILDELEAVAQSVSGSELELAPLSKVAERTRLSAIQVLGLVLGGHLKNVSLAEGERGIGGLRLSSEEVKAVAKRVLTGWSNEQVCSLLKASREACVELTKLDDVDLRLPSFKVSGINGGRDIIRFDPQKVAEFHATFATDRRIRELTGFSAREKFFWLKRHRVKPAISEAAVGIDLYRTAALPPW